MSTAGLVTFFLYFKNKLVFFSNSTVDCKGFVLSWLELTLRVAVATLRTALFL